MKRWLAACWLALTGLAQAGEPSAGQLMADVRALAAPAMEGRHAGTEGSRRARQYLSTRLAAIGVRPFGSDFAQPFRLGNGHDGANLVGYIAGTSTSKKVLVLSAHYDHLGIHWGAVYPGANDNASGVAAVLALAEDLAAHPPLHTVIVALFDGEEIGLQGSDEFTEHPPVPRERLALDLNVDMIGSSASNELFAIAARRWRKLRRYVEEAKAGAAIRVSYGHTEPGDDWTQRSDHGSFHVIGVPFVGFCTEEGEWYHSSGDTPEHIDQAFFTEAARVSLRAARVFDRVLDDIQSR